MNLDGITVALAGASGSGPYYLSSAGWPDPMLHATTTFATGFFANLPPGMVDLTFTHPMITCDRVNKGWPSTSGTMRVQVLADHDLIVSAICQ